MDATARSSCRVNRTNHAESRCVRAGNRERRTDASATCVFCRQTSVRTGRTRVLIIRLLKPEKGNNPGHWENFKDKRLLMMVEWKRRHGFQDTRGIPAAGATMEGARKDSRFFFFKEADATVQCPVITLVVLCLCTPPASRRLALFFFPAAPESCGS